MVKSYCKKVIVKRMKNKKREKVQCGLNSYQTERGAAMGLVRALCICKCVGKAIALA